MCDASVETNGGERCWKILKDRITHYGFGLFLTFVDNSKNVEKFQADP